MKRKDRVVYFDSNDLAQSSFIERINYILNDLYSYELNSISDYIELYNVFLYLRNKKFCRIYLNFKIEEIENFKGYIKRKINKFVEVNYNSMLLTKSFNELESTLNECFVYFFIENFKDYQQYVEFVKLNMLKPNFFESVIMNKTMVSEYDNEIRNFIISDCKTAEYIIDAIEISKPYCIPVSLSKFDIEETIEKYINSDCANFNYIDIIANSSKILNTLNGERIKICAREKLIEMNELFFENKEVNIGKSSFGIIIHDQIEEVKEYLDENNTTIVSYSVEWLTSNLDYPTILNNFIYLFDYVDYNNRINSIRQTEREISLSDLIGISNPNAYVSAADRHIFSMMQKMFLYKGKIYINFLLKNNINLLEVIQWYFKDYLKNTYSINNFEFIIPQSNYDYRTQCVNLVIEIEKIFQQFQHIIEFGEINQKLLYESNQQLNIYSLKSLRSDKYLEVANENSKYFYLFKKHGSVASIAIEDGDDSLSVFEAVKKGALYSKLLDYEKKEIDSLVKLQFLIIKNDIVLFDSELKVGIMYELFLYDYISLYDRSEEYIQACKELERDGEVIFKSTFFATKEADYFSYYLNNQKFSDALALRNKYAHKGNTSYQSTEQEHESNYNILTCLTILIILKLENELNFK